MPQELTDIEVEEVSLVDRPANQEARIVLFKRDAGPARGKVPVKKTALPTSIRSHVPMTKSATPVRKSDETVTLQKADGQKVSFFKEDADYFMDQADEEASNDLGGVLQALHKACSEIALSDAAPEEKQQALDSVFGEADQMIGASVMGTEQAPGLLEKCFVGGALAVTKMSEGQSDEKKSEDKDKDTEKSKSEEEDKSDEESKDVVKADDPIIKSLQSQLEKLEKRNEELEKREAVAEIRDRLRKAHAPEDQAEHLYTVKKASTEAFEAIMKGFETAGARIAKADGLTTELGGAGKSVSISKRDEMTRKVEEFRKSEAGKNMSFAKAYAHILNTDSEMAAAYAAGQL